MNRSDGNRDQKSILEYIAPGEKRIDQGKGNIKDGGARNISIMSKSLEDIPLSTIFKQRKALLVSETKNRSMKTNSRAPMVEQLLQSLPKDRSLTSRIDIQNPVKDERKVHTEKNRHPSENKSRKRRMLVQTVLNAFLVEGVADLNSNRSESTIARIKSLKPRTEKTQSTLDRLLKALPPSTKENTTSDKDGATMLLALSNGKANGKKSTRKGDLRPKPGISKQKRKQVSLTQNFKGVTFEEAPIRGKGTEIRHGKEQESASLELTKVLKGDWNQKMKKSSRNKRNRYQFVLSATKRRKLAVNPCKNTKTLYSRDPILSKILAPYT